MRRSSRLAKKPSKVVIDEDEEEEEKEEKKATKPTKKEKKKASQHDDSYGGDAADEEEEEEEHHGADDGDDYSDQPKPKKKKGGPKKKRTKKSKDDAEEQDEEDEEKPAKQHPKSKYISEAQFQAIDAAAEAAQAKSVPELKEILRKNGQKVGGSKPQLVERVSECSVLGAVPLCQSCGGGKLDFDLASCSYKCPGYMDDTDFVRCSKTFSFPQVQRLGWID